MHTAPPRVYMTTSCIGIDSSSSRAATVIKGHMISQEGGERGTRCVEFWAMLQKCQGNVKGVLPGGLSEVAVRGSFSEDNCSGECSE